MKHLIDKDTLVAEIKKLIKENELYLKDNATNSEILQKTSAYSVLNEVLHFINTLEVKEVDLDFMLHEYWNLPPKITIDCLKSATMTKDEMINFAKHFFELGLKAQKGE